MRKLKYAIRRKFKNQDRLFSTESSKSFKSRENQTSRFKNDFKQGEHSVETEKKRETTEASLEISSKIFLEMQER